MSIPAVAATSGAEPKPAIVFHTCVIHGPNHIQFKKARCGTLAVPENRSRPKGKKIKLSVAIVPAKAATPAPDPLFFIAGGPGESAIDGFFSEPGAFAAIRKRRDIVLVDQRGTGDSNPLDCPRQSKAAARLAQPGAAERKKLVRACLKHLSPIRAISRLRSRLPIWTRYARHSAQSELICMAFPTVRVSRWSIYAITKSTCARSSSTGSYRRISRWDRRCR
jgi:pimeloyl-ACP methyl ester carboxylesterase